MIVQILDIGGTHLKSAVLRVEPGVRPSLKTLLQKKTVLDYRYLAPALRRFHLDAVDFYGGVDLVIPMSFGDAAVFWPEMAGSAMPRFIRPEPWKNSDRSPSIPYLRSGYPMKFRSLENLTRRMLPGERCSPVSFVVREVLKKTYYERLFRTAWDRTHASNSGSWDHITRTFGKDKTLVLHPPFTASMDTFLNARLLSGGMDIAFIDADRFVSGGTYIVCSERRDVFHPRRSERFRVRWVEDAYGKLCRQICFKSPGKMTPEVLATIGEFFKDSPGGGELVVAGGYSAHLTGAFPEGKFDLVDRPFAQFEDAASAAALKWGYSVSPVADGEEE